MPIQQGYCPDGLSCRLKHVERDWKRPSRDDEGVSTSAAIRLVHFFCQRVQRPAPHFLFFILSRTFRKKKLDVVCLLKFSTSQVASTLYHAIALVSESTFSVVRLTLPPSPFPPFPPPTPFPSFPPRLGRQRTMVPEMMERRKTRGARQVWSMCKVLCPMDKKAREKCFECFRCVIPTPRASMTLKE